MKVELTVEQLWYNHSLMNFFMRSQAEQTLEELHNEYGTTPEGERELFEAMEDTYDDMDAMEEDLYSMTPYEFAFNIGLADEEDYE